MGRRTAGVEEFSFAPIGWSDVATPGGAAAAGQLAGVRGYALASQSRFRKKLTVRLFEALDDATEAWEARQAKPLPASRFLPASRVLARGADMWVPNG